MAAESFYTQMHTGVAVPLPASYPTSTVVGCVDIVDVMSQEKYRRLVLDATSPLENHAPWLWQCESPSMYATACAWAIPWASANSSHAAAVLSVRVSPHQRQPAVRPPPEAVVPC